MAHIKVNYSKFEATANTIETYISKHKKYMNSAEKEVTSLSQFWKGKDSTAFQNEWDKVTDNDSISHNMTEELENYAKFLRYAASQYKDAQAKAVNKSDNL